MIDKPAVEVTKSVQEKIKDLVRLHADVEDTAKLNLVLDEIVRPCDYPRSDTRFVFSGLAECDEATVELLRDWLGLPKNCRAARRPANQVTTAVQNHILSQVPEWHPRDKCGACKTPMPGRLPWREPAHECANCTSSLHSKAACPASETLVVCDDARLFCNAKCRSDFKGLPREHKKDKCGACEEKMPWRPAKMEPRYRCGACQKPLHHNTRCAKANLIAFDWLSMPCSWPEAWEKGSFFCSQQCRDAPRPAD